MSARPGGRAPGRARSAPTRVGASLALLLAVAVTACGRAHPLFLSPPDGGMVDNGAASDGGATIEPTVYLGFSGEQSVLVIDREGLPQGITAATVEARVRVAPVEAATPVDMTLYSSGVATDASMFALIVRRDAEGLRACALVSGQAVVCGSPRADALGRWCHVAATTDDSGNVRLFMDGEMSGMLDGPARHGQAHMTFGVSYVLTEASLIGDLDSVRMWSRALAAEELVVLAQGSGPFSRSGLVAEWLIDEGQGQTLTDTVSGRAAILGTNYATGGDPTWVSAADSP